MFSFGLCVFGFIMACLAAYIDKRADRVLIMQCRSTKKTTFKLYLTKKESRNRSNVKISRN